MCDSIRQGDTLPPYTAVLLDGDARYDPTLAASVTVKAWRNDVVLFSRAATVIQADGVVQTSWLTTDTNDPGPILSVVEVVDNAGHKQTFPPEGFLRTTVSPSAP